MIKCTCEYWEPNIKIINGYIDTQACHSWGNKNGYEGQPFIYCPWCGSELKDDVEGSRTKIKEKPIKEIYCNEKY